MSNIIKAHEVGHGIQCAREINQVQNSTSKKLSQDTLKEMADIKKRFADLYYRTGLAGISTNHVLLSGECFIQTFEEYQVTHFSELEDRLTACFDGTEFTCLRDKPL